MKSRSDLVPDLAAIRVRDAIAKTFDAAGEHADACAAMGDLDRRALLAYVDDLVAAVRQYASECGECAGVGITPDDEPCDECADLRALLPKEGT